MTANFTGYMYLGCYADAKVRLLDGAAVTDDSITHEQCAEYCNSISVGRFYPLIGLEEGNECFCGSSFSRAQGLANENACTMNCAGNSNENCGANGWINVFSATAIPAGITPLSTSSAAPATLTKTLAQATITQTTGPTITSTSAPAKQSEGALIGVGTVAGLMALALLGVLGMWLLQRRRGQRHVPFASDKGQLPVHETPVLNGQNNDGAFGVQPINNKIVQQPYSELPDDSQHPIYELHDREDQRYEPLR